MTPEIFLSSGKILEIEKHFIATITDTYTNLEH